ncbi:MAG: alpha/beta hydrolase fold protein [Myxococcaceae bacterium]|nr:alpha/beta hydrolase fold protein [Myxococcaceae bacterium]
MTSVLKRNNVQVTGSGQRALVFGHGFGCSQEDWKQVAPHFESNYRVVLFDLTGCGGSDLGAYDRDKYTSLQGHATDLLEIVGALGLTQVSYVGHSAGAMVGILAAIREPARFDNLAVVGASPGYIDEAGYVGGSERKQIEGVLASMSHDYLQWCEAVVPAAMGNSERPQLARELVRTFKRANAEIATHFGRAIFLSDYRSALPQLLTRTLVVQSAEDLFVPEVVGRYIVEHVQKGKLHQLRSTGHYPQLSDPEELTGVLQGWFEN